MVAGQRQLFTGLWPESVADPAETMQPISFKRHRFPPDAIRHTVWLYFHFTLSILDVEGLMAQRGFEVTRETLRCWVNKFLGRRSRPISGSAVLAAPAAGI